MKTNYVIQTNGNDLLLSDVEKEVKNYLTENKLKTKDIKEVNVYVKPLENEVYVTLEKVNGEALSANLSK